MRSFNAHSPLRRGLRFDGGRKEKTAQLVYWATPSVLIGKVLLSAEGRQVYGCSALLRCFQRRSRGVGPVGGTSWVDRRAPRAAGACSSMRARACRALTGERDVRAVAGAETSVIAAHSLVDADGVSGAESGSGLVELDPGRKDLETRAPGWVDGGMGYVAGVAR